MVALITLIAGAMFLFGMTIGKNTENTKFNLIGVLATILTFSTTIIALTVPEIP